MIVERSQPSLSMSPGVVAFASPVFERVQQALFVLEMMEAEAEVHVRVQGKQQRLLAGATQADLRYRCQEPLFLRELRVSVLS